MDNIIHLEKDQISREDEKRVKYPGKRSGKLVKKKLPVRWSPKAEQSLDGIYEYIAQDSISAAKYVKKSLIQLGGTLGHFPSRSAVGCLTQSSKP